MRVGSLGLMVVIDLVARPRWRLAGALAGASLVLPACTNDDTEPTLVTSLTETPSEASSTGQSSSETGATSTGEPGDGLARGPLQAGVAVGHLTGPVGASMAGYGLRTPKNHTPWNDVLNGASGFYGYGAAKAIALEVEGERLVLLKIPTMSSEASITEGTLAKLKELHDIDLTGRLITGATHSHHNLARYWRLPNALAGVGADSADEEIIDRIATTLAQVVADAIADLGPAEWGTASLDDWDKEDLVYRDRRGENDPTYGKDPRLTILAVRRPGADGEPMAAIFNFGMHGTVFDEDNELFTEDAPGGLEMKFEEHFFEQTGEPILAMFVQSGGGDMSPAGDRMGHPGPQRIELLGHDAEVALGVADRRAGRAPLGSLGGIAQHGENAGAMGKTGEDAAGNVPAADYQDFLHAGIVADDHEEQMSHQITVEPSGRQFAAEPGETIQQLVEALGTDLQTVDGSPLWEFIEEHPTCYEFVIVLDDSGFGAEVFIPKSGMDAELLSLCQMHATPAQEGIHP